jgi:hypothetical protein
MYIKHFWIETVSFGGWNTATAFVVIFSMRTDWGFTHFLCILFSTRIVLQKWSLHFNLLCNNITTAIGQNSSVVMSFDSECKSARIDTRLLPRLFSPFLLQSNFIFLLLGLSKYSNSELDLVKYVHNFVHRSKYTSKLKVKYHKKPYWGTLRIS